MSTDLTHLTDAETEHFYKLALKRQRTTVLSARVTPAARAGVQAIAKRYGSTPSRLLGSMLAMLAQSDTVAPKPEDLKALRAVCSALGLSPDSDAETIKNALIALLDVAAPPAPGSPDPLETGAELHPGAGRTFTTSRGAVTLSASEIESCEESGAKPEAYAENKAIRDAARRSAHARRS